MINPPLSPTRLDLIRAAVELNPGKGEGAYEDRAALLAEVDRLSKPRATWLTPTVVRGVTKWPNGCDGEIVTPDAKATRASLGQSIACQMRAKINYDGQLLCVRHAHARALHDALGGAICPEAAI
jgi:diacylglycerol kinase family enzyme